MKFNVKYNDEGTKIGATLKIKDDGLTITYVDYVINIHYRDIEDISFQNGVLRIYENDNEHIIYCSEDVYNIINSRCENTVSEEEIEEVVDVEEEKIESNKNSKSYKAIVFLPNGQGECTLSLNSKNIVIDDGVNTLRIPVSSIIRIILEDNNNIKVLSNNNKNIVIKSNKYKEIYNELKSIKKNTKHDTNATITIKDAFGNDLVQSENKQNKSSGIKLIVIVFVIIGLISLFISWINGDNPKGTIEWDIRQNQSILGYGTKYEVGEVTSVNCREQDNDGKGRYILKCDISYYPKRKNGTTAMDSKMNETIYAIYMRSDKDNFSRFYTSYVTDSFKQKSCWGLDKSKGITCSY